MKTLIWILKCISSVVLLFMITEDKFFGQDILWSDLKIAIWIDVLLLICLHSIVKPFSRPKEQNIENILYILHDGTIKAFGTSMMNLIPILNQSKEKIKLTKIIISKDCIKSEDIFI